MNNNPSHQNQNPPQMGLSPYMQNASSGPPPSMNNNHHHQQPTSSSSLTYMMNNNNNNQPSMMMMNRPYDTNLHQHNYHQQHHQQHQPHQQQYSYNNQMMMGGSAQNAGGLNHNQNNFPTTTIIGTNSNTGESQPNLSSLPQQSTNNNISHNNMQFHHQQQSSEQQMVNNGPYHHTSVGGGSTSGGMNNMQYSNLSSQLSAQPSLNYQYHNSAFKHQPTTTTQFSNYVHNSYAQQQPPSTTYPTNTTTTYPTTNYSSNNNNNQHNYEIATSFNTSPPPNSNTAFNPSIVNSGNNNMLPTNNNTNSNMMQPTTTVAADTTTDPSPKKQKRKKSNPPSNITTGTSEIVMESAATQELSEHGHPIACVQCRSRHKKCDRTLPSCLNCTKRGVECTYRSPKMKGRKDQKFHPYSSLLYIPPANTLPPSSTTATATSTQPKPKKQKKEQQIINQIVDNHFTAQWGVQQPPQPSLMDSTAATTNVVVQQQNFNPLTTIISSYNNSNSNNNNNYGEEEEEEKSIALIDGFQNNLTTTTQPNIDKEFLLNLSKDSISDLLGSLGVNTTFPNNTNNNINIKMDPNFLTTHDLITDAVLNQRLNMNAYKKRTIDLYDEVISMGYPLLSKSTLEIAFFNEESMRGIYSNDVLALLYAIHAVTCQAFGVHDEANIGFQKSRTLLTESFDNSQNIFVAGTYCHFARYCSGIGDKGKARFYLNYVDLFFRKRNKNFKSKNYLNYSIEEETKNGDNYSIFNGLPVDDLHLLKYRVLCGISVDKSGEFFLNDSSNFPGFEFGSYVSKIICDGCLYAIGKIPNTIMSIMAQKVSLENLNLYTMLVQFSAHFLTVHEDERDISETTRNIMKCLHQLFYHGCNLQLYKEAGVTDERMENEAKLFTLTTASGPFHLVQPLTLGAMMETATIHLRILSEIEQGKRSFDDLTTTYQLIELDNRALEIVRTKNKELIDRLFKPVLEQLQFRTRQFSSLPCYNSCSMAALIRDNFEYRKCSPVNQDKFNDAINVLLEELNK